MPKRLRILLDPMNMAAYLAWAAVGSGLWLSRPRGTGLIDDVLLRPTAVALHAGFIAFFLLRQLRPWPGGAHRLLVALQTVVALGLAACVEYGPAPVLLIVAIAQFAQLYKPPGLLSVFLAVNMAMYFVFRSLWSVPSPFAALSVNASFQLFAMMTSWYAVTAQRSRDALAGAHAELIAARSLLAESARGAERLRLSRELHDVAGHKLTALKLNLAAAIRDGRCERPETLARCAGLADELLADIRGVVQQMRLHDGMNLRAALEALAAPFPRPRVQLELGGVERVVDFAHAEALLRTVQESLTNAARHGHAENLWVRLRCEADRITLDIRDDGGSVDALCFGSGLSGMRERLETLGGRLRVVRGDAGGVHLSAWLPLRT